MKALFDYGARSVHEISFQKDDRMKIVIETNKSEWSKVIHLETGEQGWIPKSYVGPAKGITSEEYVFELNHQLR